MVKKNKKINYEKIGVYLAAGTLIVMFAWKIMELSDRTSKIEGYLLWRKESIEEKSENNRNKEEKK